MELEIFDIFLGAMAVVALIVFVVLYYVNAGYGMFFDKKWGLPLNNKVAWMLMEAPVFIVMFLFWFFSERRLEAVPLVFFLLFELHYFQRSFVFPFLLKGKSKMPLGIMCMGVFFNLLNGTMQGAWLFYLAPADRYVSEWFCTPQFIVGVLLFGAGMFVNIYSDHIIRGLRKPGDTAHYLPQKGMFRYVTSANYFGEIVEWCGWAILTWSLSGAVFAWWTIANLVPRADTIYRRYRTEFGKEMGTRKRVIPFIY